MRCDELPKEEIEAAAFIRANPLHDGRGIIVGVLDTGVDPGAPGLLTTSDGRPKIIDLVDCTGSGDVDTSHLAEPSAGGMLNGLSGRALALPPGWPPSKDGKYRLGLKSAFELYPRGLIGRVRAERKKRFTEAQRSAISNAQAQLAASLPAGGVGGTAEEARKLDEELRARIAALDKAEKGYADAGPVYDVLCFADASGMWRVAVDTSEEGALAKVPLLAPFRVEHKWGTLHAQGADANLNFSVDVMADGARVVICVDAGAHGTHVAGIIGAHFPERPELNGIAPGCQIIGFKIGDTRLGSMETGTALVRALGAAIERGVHVINLSYGEYASVDNAGRFAAMAERAVHKHGLIFITSAGNNGPALSTGGAPGTSDAPIAVGAFASAAMMEAQYSLREALTDIQYTWSSRGPTTDGALGVSVSAPGGAIAPVPTWTLQGRQLMNGTSMAAPNATGGVALLLSAALARGDKWSPMLIRRSIENSASQANNTAVGVGGGRPAVERWALGRGLMQVAKADAWLRAHSVYKPFSVRYSLSVTVHGVGSASSSGNSYLAHSLSGGGRGVYLREPQHSFGTDVVADVEVHPELPFGSTAAEKVALDLPISLVPSAAWLSCAPHLALTFGGKGFQLKVDLAQLPPGAHYAEIGGFDASASEVAKKAGPLFTVPVTVCKPHADLRTSGATGWAVANVQMASGRIERYFVVPPNGATCATVRLRAAASSRDGGGGTRTFVVHTTQMLPQTSVGQSESNSRVVLALPAASSSPPAEFTKQIGVTGGVTVELALAQQWNALGDAEVSLSIEFYGVQAPDKLWLDGRELLTPISLLAPFRRSVLDPEGNFTSLRRAIRPSSFKLMLPLLPLPGAPGRGDVWPPLDAPAGSEGYAGYVGYEYVLSYKTKLKEPAESLTVRFPSLQAQLYESAYEAQLFALFDGQKQLLRFGDYYTDSVKVPLGDIEIRLVLRHDSVPFLERLVAMPAVLEFKLAAPIKIEFSHSRAAAFSDAELLNRRKPGLRLPIEAGTRAQLYAITPSAPEWAESGDVLVGSVHYAAKDNESAGRRPGGYPVSMACVPPPLKDLPREGAPPPIKAAAAVTDDSSEESFSASLRELQLAQLGKLSNKLKEEAKAETAAKLKPTFIPMAAAPAAATVAPVTVAVPSVASRYTSLLAALLKESGGSPAPAVSGGSLAPSSKPPALPVLSLHLGHLDALAARNDASALASVLAAAEAVVAEIDVTKMAAALAVAADLEDAALTKEKEGAEGDKKALLVALRAKALALADLHKLAAAAATTAAATTTAASGIGVAAPQSGTPAAESGKSGKSESASALSALDAAISALHRWGAPSEHPKICAAGHAAHGRHALALAALDEALGKEKGVPTKADVEARLALLRTLGWEHLATGVEAQLLLSYPKAYPPGF